MPLEETVRAVAEAPSWEARIDIIRKIPQTFGIAQHPAVYAAIGREVYVPHLAPDFAYIHASPDYELGPVQEAYLAAHKLTNGFTEVDRANLARTLEAHPPTLRIFRLLLGFTPQEFAASTAIAGERVDLSPITPARVKGMEGGSRATVDGAAVCAAVIDFAMNNNLFPAPSKAELRSKLQKFDTSGGWATVRQVAEHGVPLYAFLHQRHYGGAFRQVLDATSTKRGNMLEDAVEAVFVANNISYIKTGSANQAEIAERFGVTMRLAPDFVVYSDRTLRALLECKVSNDGGTARDKADRFRSMKAEGIRLGGIPVFAILAGLGWARAGDAMGPVVEHTDGRVFTIPTLEAMLTVQPFPDLIS